MPTVPARSRSEGAAPPSGAGATGAPVPPAEPRGRRRRPSGEPPPLPRRLPRRTLWYLLAIGAAAALFVALQFGPGRSAVTTVDQVAMRAVSHLRTPALTRVMDVVDHLGSTWTIVGVGLATVVLLLAFRRYVHLAAYLVAVLGLSFLLSLLSDRVARIRPTGVTILGPWEGYAYPSRPVQGLALVLAGAMYTLAPVGQWRRRAAWVAAGVLGALVAARLYLGDENPSDLASAIVLGWVTVALFFGWAVPEDAFPVSYARGRRAHLDIGGRRGEAMGQALEHQLGMVLVSAEPFGLGGSAGSTPLRLRVRRTGSEEGSEVFAKLYAVNHLRSDRYYKMARSVLYGRLEDEAPFSSVRRLVEHEDHLLRVFRDLGLPSPAPLGVVEITPEREYMVLMEYLPDARELGARPLTEAEVDGGLAIVRRMWDAGLAHRDIKPSNLLLCPDGIHVIDVAFGSVRASPWRQAVDLADMMLSLALVSSPALVYARALRLFSAEDVAEAFAACRGVTVPTQLKARLREDGRDLAGEFRRLAPPRRPVAIQRWTVRRVVDAFVVLGGLALLAWLSVASRPSAGLPAAVPGCTAIQRMALVAQSVPSAAYVPCISGLAAGWSATGLRVTDGATRFDLVSDRDADHPVHVSLLPRCDTADATPIAPRAAGARSGIRLTSVSPRYAGTMTDVFAGGCLTYVFDFERGPHIPLMSEFASSVSLFPRQDLGVELRRIMGVTLGP